MESELKPFQREERYIVIKRKNLNRSTEEYLRYWLRTNNMPIVECAVVESDWPEYEPVLQMIERRCSTPPAQDTPQSEELTGVRFADQFGNPTSGVIGITPAQSEEVSDEMVEAAAKAHCDFFGGEGWWDTGLIADTKPEALEAMRAALEASTLTERLRVTEGALREIAERRIPDQPATVGGGELYWAQLGQGALRAIARAALERKD